MLGVKAEDALLLQALLRERVVGRERGGQDRRHHERQDVQAVQEDLGEGALDRERVREAISARNGWIAPITTEGLSAYLRLDKFAVNDNYGGKYGSYKSASCLSNISLFCYFKYAFTSFPVRVPSFFPFLPPSLAPVPPAVST